jgi:hypothetical protein
LQTADECRGGGSWLACHVRVIGGEGAEPRGRGLGIFGVRVISVTGRVLVGGEEDDPLIIGGGRRGDRGARGWGHDRGDTAVVIR